LSPVSDIGGRHFVCLSPVGDFGGRHFICLWPVGDFEGRHLICLSPLGDFEGRYFICLSPVGSRTSDSSLLYQPQRSAPCPPDSSRFTQQYTCTLAPSSIWFGLFCVTDRSHLVSVPYILVLCPSLANPVLFNTMCHLQLKKLRIFFLLNDSWKDKPQFWNNKTLPIPDLESPFGKDGALRKKEM